MPVIKRTMLICTSPRTGGSWLSELINSTGVLGHPEEYFHPPRDRALDRGAVAAMIAAVRERGVTENGIAGAKIYGHQFRKISTVARLSEHLPEIRYVHLYRKDLLGQTISHVRAGQTGRWHARKQSDVTPRYDGPDLRAKLEKITQHHASWLMFFARTGVPVFDVAYEDLAADPESMLLRLCAFMGIERPATAPRSHRNVVQRDRVSDEWRARFIAEYGNPDEFRSLHLPPRDGLLRSLRVWANRGWRDEE